MSEVQIKRHVLEPFLSGATTQHKNAPDVRVEVRPFLGYLNLRGDSNDEKFLQITQTLLGQSLPVTANTFTHDAHAIFWLGPDEWLIITQTDEEKRIAEQLQENLTQQCHSLSDLTGGQILLRLSGKHTRDILAKACTLDFHPRMFTAGQCAQTALAKSSMLIAMTDDRPTFDIIVRRSFAEYAALWLQHNAAEYAVEFC